MQGAADERRTVAHVNMDDSIATQLTERSAGRYTD